MHHSKQFGPLHLYNFEETRRIMRIEIRSRNLVFSLHNTKEHMRNDDSSLL